jgi:hypothetical protein
MTSTALRVFLAGSLMLGGAAPAMADQLQLSIHDGRVTLIARDVPVRQILAEWARIGKTTIVNGDQVVGPPVTLHLVDVPEAQALDALLRTASGYMAAPRTEEAADASRFDRIFILASSEAPAGGPAAAAAMPGQPGVLPQPQPFIPPQPGLVPDDPDEDLLDVVDVQQPADLAPGMAGAPGMPVQPGAPVGPPETMFNYANPPQLQLYQQQQLQQQQLQQFRRQQMAPPGEVPAVVPDAPGFGGAPNAPSFGTTSQPAPGMPPVQTSPTPGVVVPPPPQPQGAQPTFRNPYGIPDHIQPGSVVGPPQEPDRSKYANPGQPVPPPPQ